MNYIDFGQNYTSDMTINSASNSSFFESFEDFSTSIPVIQFNESLVNFDNTDSELFEETFNMSKEASILSINNLFEEGINIALKDSDLQKLKNMV